VDILAGERETACPYCRTRFSGQIFPSFWKPSDSGTSLADHALEGDAVCFFHPENRAALSCDRCGRFLCQVCDMPLGTRHLCPTCLSSGLGGDKLQELVVGRVIWANLSVLFGIFPLYLTFIITGPAAVVCGIIGWRRRGSLPRGRRRWVSLIGITLGLLQIAVWFSFVIWFTSSATWQQNLR
jgi:hypothetical protein